MGAIKCGKCKGHHGSIAEVKACCQPDLAGEIAKYIPAPNEPLEATDKQLSFIRKLRIERTLDGLPVDVCTEEPADRNQASAWIGTLLSAPYNYAVDALEGMPDKGTFTVVWPDGDRRTYQVAIPAKGFYATKGWVVVSYLTGPDNNADYQRFAHDTGDGQRVLIYRRFWNDTKLIEGLRFLLASKEAQLKAGEMYAIESSCCYRCGRKLTVPTSIHRGLGPECAKILGVA